MAKKLSIRNSNNTSINTSNNMTNNSDNKINTNTGNNAAGGEEKRKKHKDNPYYTWY